VPNLNLIYLIYLACYCLAALCTEALTYDEVVRMLERVLATMFEVRQLRLRLLSLYLARSLARSLSLNLVLTYADVG
jgi:hypothetical protein